MLKPNEIREIITRYNDYLRINPDKLQVYIDNGKIVCTGAHSLSYEYNYTLTVIVQDFDAHADLIILPLLVYLRTNQPELFENYDKNKDAINFEIDFLNQSTIDLMLKIPLTERVLVTDADGKLTALHTPEPEHPDYPDHDYVIEVINRRDNEKLGNIIINKWQPTL